MTELQQKSLKINPDRICEAIAKIGYTPQSAILDIVDNSVSAGATIIEIEFKLKEGAANISKNGIEEVIIRDNGKGMSSEGIGKAFDFGSDVEYSKNSLSKYGIGLKAAGFSLGRAISVISKVSNSKSINARILDRDIILEQGLVYENIDATEEENDYLKTEKKGTVVKLSKLRKGLPSANRIESLINDVIGTTYLGFFTRKKKPLVVKIISKNKVHIVEPRDMLFWEDAQEGYDPDNFNPLLPFKSLSESIPLSENPDAQPIKLKVSLFPREKTYKLAKTEEEKKKFQGFQVSQKNKGLYIYRNGRLIRWAEKPTDLGINDKNLIGFRATVEFYTDHDDYFHVDVSKQELEFPEDFTEKLARSIIQSKADCRDLYERSGRLVDNHIPEGEEFNGRTEDFEEEDFDEINPEDIKEVNKRRKQQQEVEEPDLPDEEIGTGDKKSDEEVGTGDKEPDEEPVFKRIRYSESVNGLDLWCSHVDKEYGTYVLINKRHPFYALISQIGPSDPSRLAIESLIYCLACGFNKTERQFTEIDPETINRVHLKDKQFISQLLNDWVSRNLDLG